MPKHSTIPTVPTFADAFAYSLDAWQRSILFLDVMRQRGEQYEKHTAETAPHVLNYEAELVVDGRKLEKPVNYALVRIIPPEGIVVDPLKRPFVVVDPRAGHGPGIGGFKADSEIGVAMKAGHPCYFIGFLPEPVPGQTIEDIAGAEAIFLETVIARHADADGKPCVVGNCQAGWAVMILAALRPELFGPIIIAGTPLSYWAGVRGQYPMRYSGGLLGGSWLTALTSDLGAGIFDGAWLVQNFENQNPANTLWTKQYNLYSNIDTEGERYLGFERWWGGHVTLNAEEMQFIVDELFVGNKLAAGEIRTSDGTAIDLRNIHSPIVVFCSKGDNITPPPQALDWILDLYDSVDEIRAHGQTIVYAVHDKIGHLGIFVSAGVARKEHDEFASNIAEAMRRMHPLRLQYEIFGPSNPLMGWIEAAAAHARENRKPAVDDNPFLALQENMSRQIVDGLEAWRRTVEHLSEETFRTVYGAPALQAALGIDRNADRPRKPAKSHLHQALLETRIAALRAGVAEGGLREALARALLFVGKARGGADERGFEAIRRLRRAHPTASQLTLPEFKALLRKQYFILLIDEEAALSTIPKLLPEDLEERRSGFNALREVLQASGAVTGDAAERLERIERLFGLESAAVPFVARKTARERKTS
ncbi:DUF3141 domain-containing protein [Sinorhizobium fredii]|uniref:DUF3141 domain-containing protein n=1 Tax=Rhizobium fredii TaxID=380 RepID=UPI0004B417F4|nr:DUF3141 domain-containing protein [Sinorhizobium fredii]